MAPKNKASKGLETINARLGLVMKSGKYTLGYKSTLKSLRSVCYAYEYTYTCVCMCTYVHSNVYACLFVECGNALLFSYFLCAF